MCVASFSLPHPLLALAVCVMSGKNSGRKGARWWARTPCAKLSQRPVVAWLTDPVLQGGAERQTGGERRDAGPSVGVWESRASVRLRLPKTCKVFLAL